MKCQSIRFVKLGLAVAPFVVLGGLGVSGCNSVLGIGEFTAMGNCERKGALRCNEQKLAVEVCSEEGKWKEKEVCTNKTCDPATLACVGECAKGSKRCAGATPQECNGDGIWAPTPTGQCGIGTHCVGGACVVDCTPEDVRCEGQQPQKCNQSGEWQNRGPSCAPPCSSCDPNTGVCSLDLGTDGQLCTDPTNKCISGVCQDGMCSFSDSIKCISVSEASGPGICSLTTCDPATGTCIPVDGTPCNDGDICTMDSYCKSGSCTSSPSSDHKWAHWDLKAPSPSPRYTWTGGGKPTKDDVVYDTVTRLVWQRKISSIPYNWADAKEYCKCLNDESDTVSCEGDKIRGYPWGWRLPTRIELASIVDYTRAQISINLEAFSGTPPENFWSSSSFVGSPFFAWFVRFGDGAVNVNDVGGTFPVRCVR